MLRLNYRQALALLSTTLLMTSMLTAGCGRNAVNPLASDDKSASASPGDGPTAPDDPGTPDDPGNVIVPPASGGGAAPAPAGGGGAPAPVKPAGSKLRPLPQATPTPAPAKAGDGGGGSDPQKDQDAFIQLLRQFGFGPAFKSDDDAIADVRTQLLPLMRVPDSRFGWANDPNLGLLYGRRKGDFPAQPSFDQWKAAGLDLARRTQSVSFFVSRRAFYRDIIGDRYSDAPPNELIFYKRLNRTGYMVSYKPSGQIVDYGFWPEITWRDFIAVPAAFMN